MKSREKTITRIVANGVLIFYAAIAIIPFVILISSSFSDQAAVLRSGYVIFPRAFSLSAYKYLAEHVDQIIHAYAVTVVITAVGTSLGVFFVSMIAYPLSRKDLPGRRFFLFFVFFTMLFNGGLLPTYFMYTKIFGIKNTYFALLIPALLLNAVYILIARTFFSSNIPSAVIESAKIDGANEFKIFFRIVMPMGKTIIATVGLFIGIGYWNDWYNGMIYLTDNKLYNIQNLLTRMITDIQMLTNNANVAGRVSMYPLPSVTVRMAIAVVGVLPVVVMFPFIQRFFIKGIALGSLKE
jgi:putative aldouronate transport system permease protein